MVVSAALPAELHALISRHWGIEELRPLQAPAMQAVLSGRDSLVVLPTGGGKSLCYQAPAVLRGDTTVVISPLISLMKDQVDALRSCGIKAVKLDSSETLDDRLANAQEIRNGTVSLVFVSPERLIQTDLGDLFREINVRTFAIDEAHCISHWGHDFRPEYRQLARLKDMFPQASVHAYTATATEHVRRDIVEQLRLADPEILVGDFDRPNLKYRVWQRRDAMRQALEVIDRFRREAGIIYCLRRADVDRLASSLRKQGIKAMPYHAGMEPEDRKATQEAFIAEQCDVVVATVAFGMGIDRSNVRYVLHVGMPKSLEHYQQEAGRAGRDGLEAECILLYSGADFFTWKSIIERSASEPGVDPSFLTGSLKHLRDVDNYCRGASCRHAALVRYFGQDYDSPSCEACDLCLGETVGVPDAQVIAQKILSCVARVNQRFGVSHVVSVLRGENTQNIRAKGHEKLSTYGLLRDNRSEDIREWVYQLIGQDALVQADLEISEGMTVPILKLNSKSLEVMRGQREVRLLQPVAPRKAEPRGKRKDDDSLSDGAEKDLFEELRALRRRLATERNVPPYVIFSDVTLRELCRTRPSTLESMRRIYGIGDAKLRDLGDQFLKAVQDFCARNGLDTDA